MSEKWKTKLRIKNSDRRDIVRAMALLSQIGLNMAVIIIGSILLGKFLDDKLGTGPWFLLVLTLLGVLSALRNLYILAMRDIDKK